MNKKLIISISILLLVIMVACFFVSPAEAPSTVSDVDTN